MQDEPTLGQLLEAVAELLADEIMPITDDGVLRFRIRVALNALAIARRELDLGADLLERERRRLESLLGGEDPGTATPAARRGDTRQEVVRLSKILSDRIDAGQAPAGAFDHLVQTELERLAIASPKFLARVQPDLGAAGISWPPRQECGENKTDMASRTP